MIENLPPPKTPDPVTASVAERPWQFSLRQLMVFTAVVCALGAAYHWVGPGIFLLVGLTLIVGFIALAIAQKRVVDLIVVAVLVCAVIALLYPW